MARAVKATKQGYVRVKLVRSLICSKKDQIATAHALGLHRIGDSSVQPDIPATQGKIRKIAHLIEVKEACQGGAK
ncbi:MAG: 50S ribosomal protein L30 [Clostridiales bacterium]|jgi:large subunit ribosomal protein L30|nr:50S ribosomal protein L30 [Clostridiales bacterium]